MTEEKLKELYLAKLKRRVLQKNPKRTRNMSYEEFLAHTRFLSGSKR